MGIRPYAPADRDACLEAWLEASRVGHPFLSEEALAADLALVRDVYLVQADTHVVEVDGEVRGFIGLLGPHVGGLFVHPRAHGRGLGRALVEHATARRGALTVEVYEANPIAPAFYRRCGFVDVGRKPVDDQGRPFPLLCLRRPG